MYSIKMLLFKAYLLHFVTKIKESLFIEYEYNCWNFIEISFVFYVCETICGKKGTLLIDISHLLRFSPLRGTVIRTSGF